MHLSLTGLALIVTTASIAGHATCNDTPRRVLHS